MHRKHIGTGSRTYEDVVTHADGSWSSGFRFGTPTIYGTTADGKRVVVKNADEVYRDDQYVAVSEGRVGDAIQLNQLGYSVMYQHDRSVSDKFRWQADNSFAQMVVNLERFPYYEKNSHQRFEVQVTKEERAEMILSRLTMQVGSFPSRNIENIVRRIFKIAELPTSAEDKGTDDTNDRKMLDILYSYVSTNFEKTVTSVSLNKNTLELYTGQSELLIATVTPDDATNKAVTWESSNTEVATVENGTVTAKAAGTATITVTTTDSNYTATCTVTVTQSTYSISADTEALNFGSAYTGYTQPAAQTVTVENAGNQTLILTLTQPASTGSFGVGSLSKSELAPGEKATFTVQPKAGLAVGTYREDIAVTSSEGATVTITASFTVKQYSSGGSSSSTPSVSDQAIDKIEVAKDGSTVKITLRTGQTKLDKEVFKELAGRDVTLEISLNNGVTWTVNGQDIPENAKLSDLDLGVTLDASTIPVSVINAITGAVDTIQLSLKHDGAFGFTMTLTAPLGKTNAGYWANLYYYDEGSRALEFQAADKIASDGTAEFPFDHASQYAIVIDTDSHEPVELPFTDVPEDAWYADAAAYVYKHGLMAGTSATTFAPDVTTSRAMIATVLWRMAGSPVVNYAMTYTDVDPAAWYGEAVRWATSEGVVTGYGNGLFGTNDPITREQFAVMLYRYAKEQGYDVSVGEDTNMLSYTDVVDLSEYAIPAMQWACGAGVINGTGDSSTLTPQGQATRTQAAVMLMRFGAEYVVW